MTVSLVTFMGTKLASVRGNKIARLAAWVLGGQTALALMQALYFVIIARALHARGFGEFVAALAIVAVMSPLAGWGAANILVRKTACAPDRIREHLGEALGMSVVGSAAVGIAAFFAARWLLPEATSPWLIVALVAADLGCGRVFEIAEKLFLATGDGRRGSMVGVVATGMKVLAASLLWVTCRTPSSLDWALLYLLSTVAAATVILRWLTAQHGTPTLCFSQIWKERSEGFYFAISLVAQNTYNDIDKTLLSRFASLEATGFYAAAYRIINVAFTPIRAFLYAAYAHFFQRGVEGPASTVRFARSSVPGALLYSFSACIGLNLTAPVIPWIFGSTFQQTVEAVRWLSLLPLLKSLHYLAGDALTGAGLQARRVAAQTIVALLSIVLSILGIRFASWRGAAVASLSSDALLATIMWIIALRSVAAASTSSDRSLA